MLTDDSSAYFYEQIVEIMNNANFAGRTKILKFRQIFNNIFEKLTEEEKQFFSSNFSRVVYVVDKYELPDELISYIKKLRYFTKKASKDKEVEINDSDITAAAQILTRIIAHFSENDIPEALQRLMNETICTGDFWEYSHLYSEIIPFLKVIIKKGKIIDKKTSKILAETEDYGDIELHLSEHWKDIPKMAWKGAALNLFDIKRGKKKENAFYTTSESLVVLEPDYLVDVTEISECFHAKGVNVYLYFLKHYSEKRTTFPLVLGNIVNHCFDVLLTDPEIDLDTAFAGAIKSRPMQIFALAAQQPESINMLRKSAAGHFFSLKKFIPDIKYDRLSVEPSFISPKYGLQGRLDLMLEFNDDSKRKDVIELKSGNAPGLDLKILGDGGIPIKTGIWHNHIAQTTCYNLLLDSTDKDRTGSSMILYTKADQYPFRNTPNIILKKQEVVNARNWIVALEKSLMDGTYSLLNSFTPKRFGFRPPFKNDDIQRFEYFYNEADDIEKAYFHSYISFILRELYATKTGHNDSRGNGGFSSLWNSSPDEKAGDYTILSNLRIDLEETDFDNYYVVFSLSEVDFSATSFRKGDYVLIYPVGEDGETELLKRQLIKCVIKEISPAKVVVSLRNKQFEREIFTDNNFWTLEKDYIDTTNKSLMKELYKFLTAEPEKKQMLLGRIQPQFNKQPMIKYPGLNDNQNQLFTKSVAAQDYFLLQGPPGTGKTSYMLKAIVDHIYHNTKENILILAYTNRAVDEICTALKKISPEFPFLRTGAKESSEHTDRLISLLAQKMQIRELYEMINGTRIIVSTVSSVITNPEIMEIKEFHTAVIDEASQILEPQLIGILASVNRFIMIGDEKQLPAIVVQDQKDNIVKNEDLISLGLPDLRNSLFERLLRNCKTRGWTEAAGMLNRQARMHNEIMSLANKFFYNDRLCVFDDHDWQTSPDQKFDSSSENNIERMLTGKRIIFIESDHEPKNKVHTTEARRVSSIIKTIKNVYGDEFDENTVGVITPFRAQCSEIMYYIPEELRDLITVDTVERFQGSEREIIIVSFAVNYKFLINNIQSVEEIDGISVDRKLNVAVTRARQRLILLGSPEILHQSEIYSSLVNYIKEQYGYIESNKFESLIQFGEND